MNKSVAHSVLIIIDLAAIYACFYVYSAYSDITQLIDNSAESITIQKPTGLYIVLIMVPIVHGTGFFNIPKRFHKIANSVLVILFALMVFTGVYIDSDLERKIVKSGYTLCESMTEQFRVSEFVTYLRDSKKCTE